MSVIPMIIYEARDWQYYGGRWESCHLAYFITEEEARTATMGASREGFPADEQPRQLVVYDIETWQAKVTAEHRERGLNKLSVEERKALGLSEA
jgi:hypothetical protein